MIHKRQYRIFDSQDSDPSISLRCDSIEESQAIDAMTNKEIRILGELYNSTNGAMLGEIEISDDFKVTVIVKSAMYENPLVDFEWGSLVKREVAAYEISKLLDFNIVPPTVLRDVNKMQCSVQLFVPHNPRRHYFNITKQRRDDIEQFVVFDYITNNADRKAGHVLEEITNDFDLYLDSQSDSAPKTNSRLYSIDHGLTFHTQDKLRTVIWEFAEQKISDYLMEKVHLLHPQVESISNLITVHELEKTIERIEGIMLNPYHRALDETLRSIPYPLV